MTSSIEQLVSSDGRVFLSRLDSRDMDIAKDENLLFACVRNEELRLPYFIEYHRQLGVERFFVVDNGSDDGTLDVLLGEDRVHVFRTDSSYAGSRCGVDWLNLMLKTYGIGHWSLTLDADELFVYPMCENVGLHALGDYLDAVGAEAIVSFMLDMYSDCPVRETVYSTDQAFGEVCRYFDLDTYHQTDADGVPVRGGPRHRLFWEGRDGEKPSPMLKKIPFAKWRKDLSYEASTHILRGARLAEITGVIQHYKFFSDFYQQAKAEMERKEHWNNAAQYETYWRVLSDQPDLTACFAGSVEFTDSTQLVNLGLMKAPQSYLHFLGMEN